MKSIIIFILFLASSVYGQNLVIKDGPTFTTTLLSLDTLTNEEIKTLKIKSNRVYNDSVLDMETYYDRNGNKICQKCYNGHLCRLDSFFYSKGQELHRSYDESNKLKNWYKKYKSGNTVIEEYYDKQHSSNLFRQAYKRELRFKDGKVVYRKSIEYEKLQSIENIKYDTKGMFLESEETHYDYKKDSLVNVTTIRSKKDKPIEMTHTNSKYKHYSIDASSEQGEFDYTDRNEDYIQAYDNQRVAANLVFDRSGNIKESENFVRLGELLVKVIYRTYDIKNKTYIETINLQEYYNNGLIKNSGHLNNIYAPQKIYCKYEYY